MDHPRQSGVPMSEAPASQRRFLTEILLDAGVVTRVQIEAALAHQAETGRRIGETLVGLGLVSEEDIAWALARQLGLSFVDVRGESLDHDLVRAFPEPVLRRLQLVPLVQSEDRLAVAAADPTDHDGLRELESLAGTAVECSSATAGAIDRALDAVFGTRLARRGRGATPDAEGRHDAATDRSGESFLRAHVSRALEAAASEIHFVADGGVVRVYHRTGLHIVPLCEEPPEAMELLTARLEAFGMPA